MIVGGGCRYDTTGIVRSSGGCIREKVDRSRKAQKYKEVKKRRIQYHLNSIQVQVCGSEVKNLDGKRNYVLLKLAFEYEFG